MARYNEILVGRFARSLQKLFGQKGEVPVGSLAGEVQSVHQFLTGVENRYLESWNKYGTRVQAPAVAAAFAAVSLRNPLTSNVIAVLESIVVFSQAAVSDNPVATEGAVAVDLAGGISGTQVLDSRSIGFAASVASFGSAAAIGRGNAFNGTQFAANTSAQMIFDEDQEVPVLPGSALTIWSNVLNQSITVCFMWRERQLEESERA